MGRTFARCLVSVIALGAVSACSSVPGNLKVDMDAVAKRQDRKLIEGTVEAPVPLADRGKAGPEGTLARDVADVFAESPWALEAMLGLSAQNYSVAQVETANGPRVDLNANAGGTDSKGATEFKGTAGVGAALGWTVYDPGEGPRSDRERFRAVAQVRTVHERGELIGANVVESHIDVPRHRSLVALRGREIAEKERFLKRDVAKAVSLGMASEADRANAAASAKKAKDSLSDSSRNLKDAEDRYFRLLGRRPVEMAEPAPLEVDADKEAEVAKAAGHPSLGVIYANIQAAVANAVAVDAERLGSFGLDAGLTWSKVLASGINPFALSANFLKVALPLVDSGERGARVAKSVATVQVGEAQMAQTERDVAMSVRLAHNAWASAVERKAIAEARLKDVRSVLATYKAEYADGLRSTNDVLRAIDDAYDAEATAVNARYTAVYASYVVQAKQGRLLRTLGAVDFVEVKVDGQTDPWERVALSKGLFVRK